MLKYQHTVKRAIRMSRLARAVVLSVVGASTLPAQQGLAGTWRGYWARAGDTLPVTVDVRRDSGTYQASFSSTRLRVSGIPFVDVKEVAADRFVMTLRGDRTTTAFTGELRGDSLTGTFVESGANGQFAYRRVDPAAAAVREREVTFRNGDVTLSGTLLSRRASPMRSAIVFLHGSGAESRWASRYLAEQVAESGTAALIFDKRGVGRSSGDWQRATIDDLVGDGLAAVTTLLTQEETRGLPIGVFGHSQGGTLSPMLAAKSPNVAFIIASAATGIPTDSTEIYSIGNSVLPRARSGADSVACADLIGELVAVAYKGRPRDRLDVVAPQVASLPCAVGLPAPAASYWTFSRSFDAFSPEFWWRQVRVPVLLLYGENDQRVPPRESARRIAAYVTSSGNSNVTSRVFPGADHTMRLAPGQSGWPRSAPDYVPSILTWLAGLHSR